MVLILNLSEIPAINKPSQKKTQNSQMKTELEHIK